MAILKFAVFCCSAMLMCRRRTASIFRRPFYYYCNCFYEVKLFSLKLILLLFFFSRNTPLHFAAPCGHLDVCRLLVESKADVAAKNVAHPPVYGLIRCFSPPPSHHVSLTICLAAVIALHLVRPSTTTKPTSLHTCAASARLSNSCMQLQRAPYPAPTCASMSKQFVN